MGLTFARFLPDPLGATPDQTNLVHRQSRLRPSKNHLSAFLLQDHLLVSQLTSSLLSSTEYNFCLVLSSLPRIYRTADRQILWRYTVPTTTVALFLFEYSE